MSQEGRYRYPGKGMKNCKIIVLEQSKADNLCLLEQRIEHEACVQCPKSLLIVK